MGTNALESYNLVESKGALLNIDAPRPDEHGDQMGLIHDI